MPNVEMWHLVIFMPINLKISVVFKAFLGK